MPGMCGGVGVRPELVEALVREFTSIWGEADRNVIPGGTLAAHAFGDAQAIFAANGVTVAVDGEISAYRNWGRDGSRLDRFFRISNAVLDLTRDCRANLVVFNGADRSLYLATQWSSGLPLYYAEYDGGLLFSSHLRPLAKVTDARIDLVGTVEFLRQGCTLAGRSHYSGIARMYPGQMVRFDTVSGRLSTSDRSRLWVGINEDLKTPDDAAAAAWDALCAALGESIPGQTPTALMLSAGWDSRTLLAGSRGLPYFPNLLCYSHGDLESRELRLARRIAESVGARARQEPITDEVLDAELLQAGFLRSENVVFPHWHRAGRILAANGVECVFAGVYGAVLGGHYGPSNLVNGWQKVSMVGGLLLGGRRGARPGDANALEAANEFLRLKSFQMPWYMSRELQAQAREVGDEINGDVQRALAKLSRRGVGTYDQLVEAYQSEHRGGQYIDAQTLNCRAHLDVANPLADRAVFEIASTLPMELKIHNSINRRMLQMNAPDMLRFPLAATLAPASAPVWLQEASRAVRKLRDAALWKAHFATRGRVSGPRMGWVNFEFMRTGRALRTLVADLRSDIWDRDALERKISDIEQMGHKQPLHPMYDQLSKIYTTDLMLRTSMSGAAGRVPELSSEVRDRAAVSSAKGE